MWEKNNIEEDLSMLLKSFDHSLECITKIKESLCHMQEEKVYHDAYTMIRSMENSINDYSKQLFTIKRNICSNEPCASYKLDDDDDESTDCEEEGGSPSMIQDEYSKEMDTEKTDKEIGNKIISPTVMKADETINKINDDVDYFDDEMCDEFELSEVEASFKQVDDDLITDKTTVTDTSENLADVTAASSKHIKVLKEYFGFTKFRPMQWKVIQSVLDEKRNNCVVMATGAGKSLCYQYPPVYSQGVGLVISPLISLMEDQVQALNLANIEACYLGSAQLKSREILNKVHKGFYRLVYVTPEYVTGDSNFLQTLVQNVKLTCIAIDEAHCVSQWGHDFRKSYRKLSLIQSTLPQVPIIALTATATPQVRLDICNNLKLKNPIIRCTGFDRKNLFLEVKNKSSIFGDLSAFMKEENINGHVRYSFEGTTIIYCPTKKKTEEVYQVLESYGILCAPYHAGLSFDKRKEAHYKFIRDELNCIIATVAFGMGIDKPDIRLVIHYGAPKDIESYYQEIGRAGRDGLPSHCCAFYNNADFSVSRHFLNEITNPKFRQYKSEMIVKMEQYLMSSTCRRQAILSHFDEGVKNVGGTTSCCDNCKRRLDNPNSFINQFMENSENHNFGEDVKTLLQAIMTTGNGRFGLAIPVLLLRGSESQKLPSKYHGLSMHGKGRLKSDRYWKALGRQLIMEGILMDKPVTNGFGSTVAMTTKGQEFLDSNKKNENPVFNIKNPNKDMLEEVKAKMRPDEVRAEKVQVVETNILPPNPKKNAWTEDIGTLHEIITLQVSSPGEMTTPVNSDSIQKELLTKLISVRRVLARKLDIPPYMVATNKNLIDMTQIRPTSVEHLMSNVDGISERLCQRFGKSFVEEIASFCKLQGIKSNLNSCDSQTNSQDDTSETINTLQRGDGFKAPLTATVLETFEHHTLGKSIDDICASRGLVEDTVHGHLATALKYGYPINFPKVKISNDDIKKVVQTVRSQQIGSDIQRLRAIKDMLPSSIGYGKLRFIITMLEITYGITKDPVVHPDLSKFKNTPPTKPFFRQSSGSNAQNTSAKRKVPDWMSSRNSHVSYKRTNSKNRKIF